MRFNSSALLFAAGFTAVIASPLHAQETEVHGNDVETLFQEITDLNQTTDGLYTAITSRYPAAADYMAGTQCNPEIIALAPGFATVRNTINEFNVEESDITASNYIFSAAVSKSCAVEFERSLRQVETATLSEEALGELQSYQTIADVHERRAEAAFEDILERDLVREDTYKMLLGL